MKTILIASSKDDGNQYLEARPHLRPAVIVTPRSMNTARGSTGTVYVTPAGRTHPKFKQMVAEVIPAATLIYRDRIS